MRHFVNNALLFGNSSAPVARVVSLQRFGFTQALERVVENIMKEGIDFIKNRFVRNALLLVLSIGNRKKLQRSHFFLFGLKYFSPSSQTTETSSVLPLSISSIAFSIRAFTCACVSGFHADASGLTVRDILTSVKRCFVSKSRKILNTFSLNSAGDKEFSVFLNSSFRKDKYCRCAVPSDVSLNHRLTEFHVAESLRFIDQMKGFMTFNFLSNTCLWCKSSEYRILQSDSNADATILESNGCNLYFFKIKNAKSIVSLVSDINSEFFTSSFVFSIASFRLYPNFLIETFTNSKTTWTEIKGFSLRSFLAICCLRGSSLLKEYKQTFESRKILPRIRLFPIELEIPRFHEMLVEMPEHLLNPLHSTLHFSGAFLSSSFLHFSRFNFNFLSQIFFGKMNDKVLFLFRSDDLSEHSFNRLTQN